MLTFIGFSVWEQELLREVAAEITVASQCEFVNGLEIFDDMGSLRRSGDNSRTIPALLFLNFDPTEFDWETALNSIKSHPVLSSVPLVGLGNISDSKTALAYELGASSVIRKPDTREEMVQISKTTLNFWLHFSQLPHRHLTEEHLD